MPVPWAGAGRVPERHVAWPGPALRDDGRPEVIDHAGHRPHRERPERAEAAIPGVLGPGAA